jgi:hypothetical protein
MIEMWNGIRQDLHFVLSGCPKFQRPPKPKTMTSNASSSSTATNINSNTKNVKLIQDDDTADAALDEISKSMVDDVMLRLTKGLPRFELDLIVKEANECERALIQEIAMLEREAAAATAAAAATTTATTAAGSSNPSDTPATASETKPVEERSSSTPAATTTTTTMQQEGAQGEALPYQYGLGMPFATVDEVLNSEYTTVDRFITLSALLGRLFVPVPLPESHPYAIALEEANKKVSKQQKYQQKRRVVRRQQQLLALQHSPMYTKRSTTEQWTTMLTSLWKKISR